MLLSMLLTTIISVPDIMLRVFMDFPTLFVFIFDVFRLFRWPKYIEKHGSEKDVAR